MLTDIKDHVLVVPNWPREGITTYDIAPILHNSIFFRKLIEKMAEPYKNQKIDTIVGIEARGFVLASALAWELQAGVALIRKKGKIPPPVISQEYSFEYASYVMEISDGIIKPQEHIVLVDDILATGGTMAAAIKLVNKTSSQIIGVSCVIEMEYMVGRDRLRGQEVHSIINYN